MLHRKILAGCGCVKPAERRAAHIVVAPRGRGQSYVELAAILDVPVGTVRSRLLAAREALRALWNESPAMKGCQR